MMHLVMWFKQRSNISASSSSSSAVHLPPSYPSQLPLFSAAAGGQFSSSAAFQPLSFTPPVLPLPVNGLPHLMFAPLNDTSSQLIDSARLLSSLAPYLPPPSVGGRLN